MIDPIAAAGNNAGSMRLYPAAYPETLSVGGTGMHDFQASDSNLGAGWVDVAAPDPMIFSTFPNHPNGLGPQNYGYLSGTSESTAFTSGLATARFSANWPQWPVMHPFVERRRHPSRCPNAMSADASTDTPTARSSITVVDPGLIRRAVAAAAVGNVTEWFDFGVFAYMATTIGKVFYPDSSPTAQLLATFGTFAAAFLVRPLGGLFFGPLGDRIGRTRVLAATMIMMAAGTFCIGIIPDYNTLGMAAPILLLLARLIQGFSTGGEYGGAMTFIAEYAPDRRRGFLGSWLEFGTLVGYIMGAAIVTILSATLSQADLLSWGWRIPFLIAGPLGVVGMYLRLKLEETPAFAKLIEHQEQRDSQAAKVHSAKSEFREIFLRYWPAMLLCGSLVLTWNVINYMLTSYMPTYLSSELPPKIGDTESYLLQIAVMTVMLLMITFVGRFSDRVGRRPVVLGGCILSVVLAIPSLMLIQQNTTVTVFAGLMLMGVMLVIFSGVLPSTLPAMFPTGIRQGALSISFNVFVSLFGGTVATVMTALIAATGDLLWPAYYLMGAGVIGAIGMWFTKETANKPLLGSPASVESDT